MFDDFDFDQFLNTAGGVYSAYAQQQSASDNAAAANALKQQQLLAGQSTAAMSAQTKTYIMLGAAALVAIIALVLVFKRK